MSQKEKLFLDVFPNLQLEEKLSELMEQVVDFYDRAIAEKS